MNPAEFQANTPYANLGVIVADAPVDARRSFIRKTYTHLMAAIYAFVALTYLWFQLEFDVWMMKWLGGGLGSIVILMIGFMAVAHIANRWALSDASIGKQYAGLFLYVVAQSVIFLPLLSIAMNQTVTIEGAFKVGVIPAAAVTTLVIFGGLTAFTFLTKKDFSFMGGFLSIAMFAAIALAFASLFFGFHLGILFSWAMVVLMSGYILYYTSNVIHHYRTEQHVAASLALFASIALLFWYVIQIFLASRD